MVQLKWDLPGERLYETGVDHGVLYPTDNTGAYADGVPFNGLVNVTESPSGAEATAIYADNIKYLNLYSAEEFGATIEAFYSPKEFDRCDGSAELVPGVKIGQQRRESFGFSYRTLIGNDVMGTDFGYKIHLVYGAMASPSEKTRSTVNESPEAVTFSWEVTTTPIQVPGFKPSATVVFSSLELEPAQMKQIEDILYGTELLEPRLLLPSEIVDILGTPVEGAGARVGVTESFGFPDEDETV